MEGGERGRDLERLLALAEDDLVLGLGHVDRLGEERVLALGGDGLAAGEDLVVGTGLEELLDLLLGLARG